MVIFMEYRKNDIVTLKIEDCGIDGEGIGKADGFTVFVKDAVIVSLELDADTITAHCRHCVYSVIWQQLSGIVHKEQRNEPNLHTAADLRKGRFQSVCT